MDPAKAKKKKQLVVLAVVTTLLAGGGGTFFALKGKGHTEHAENADHADGADHAEAGHADSKEVKKGHDGEKPHKSGESGESHDSHGSHKAENAHGSEHADLAEEEDSSKEESSEKDEDNGHDSHEKAKSASNETKKSDHGHSEKLEKPKGPLASLFAEIKFAVMSIQRKVDRIQQAEKLAEILKLENANLRQKTEAMQMSCQAALSEKKNKTIESAMTRDTGSRIGRTLASISYKPPSNLFPDQLFTLASAYFVKQDDERAAVIFTYLTNLEDSDKFKTAKILLMTGVAWYRIENFELARDYFDRVLKTEAKGENLKFHAHARLWQGLASHRVGQFAKTQTWLKAFMDNHPKAKEAAWINAKRGLASVGEEPEAHGDHGDHGRNHGKK